MEMFIVTVWALPGWPAEARPGAGARAGARSLTGAGTVGGVRVRAVEVIVAGADAGGWRSGAAVGGTGETGPLSLLRLVAPRGTGCGGEEEGRAQLPSFSADTNPPHHRENLALPQHLPDCGGHAGIAQLPPQLQKALFPRGNPTSANSSLTLPPTRCPDAEDFSLDSLGL